MPARRIYGSDNVAPADGAAQRCRMARTAAATSGSLKECKGEEGVQVEWRGGSFTSVT